MSLLSPSPEDPQGSHYSDASKLPETNSGRFDKVPTIPYRADIDGLRALAVLPVLFFHAGLGFPGGFVGVDIFFVISGYLIGSLVITEINSGTFRIINFWERRVRRIFPVLAAVVIATLVAGYVMMVPGHFRELGESIISLPLFISNVYFWQQTGYFETASEFQPLLHTWSLAVEEQFYLIFPPLMVLFMRRGLETARRACLIFFVLSLAFSIYGSIRFPSLSFFLIPSRIWELDLGLLLALIPKSNLSRNLGSSMGLLGLALIFWSFFEFGPNTVFPGYAALLPCLGAAFVIYSNSGVKSLTNIFLGCRPLVFIGKISYSLYLWHWPMIVFVKYHQITDVSHLQMAGTLGFSFIFACLSWKYIETPFRRKFFFRSKRNLFALTTAVGAISILVGFLLHISEGAPSRFPSHITKHVKVWSPVQRVPRISQLVETGTLPSIGASVENASGRMLVWGDSHAAALLPALDTLGKKNGITVFAAIDPGTAPVLGTHSSYEANQFVDVKKPLFQFIKQNEIEHILISARWSIYVLGFPSGGKGHLLCDNETHSKTAESAERIFVKHLAITIRELKKMGVKVWLMRDVGTQPRSVPETVAQAASRGLDLNSFALPLSFYREKDQAINNMIDRALDGSEAEILDPMPYLTNSDGIYMMAKGDRALFNDRDHLSPFGSSQLEPILSKVIETAKGAR